MNIGIVTNQESRGLALDAQLLSEVLVEMGHTVEILQFDKPHTETFDLIIFLEVLVRQLIGLSKLLPWFIPNMEFMREGDVATVRSSIGNVLCKTREGFRICSGLFGEQAIYTGWIARDRNWPDTKRVPQCLHIAGHSQVKNTQAVIDAWRWEYRGKKLTTPLAIVADFVDPHDVPANITVFKDLSDTDLQFLQNQSKFHLQPSATEGFGHVLRESLSVNALLITTNAPPMSEIETAYLIDATPGRSFNHSILYDVSALDIYRRVTEMVTFNSIDLPAPDSRQEFLEGNAKFKTTFATLFEKDKDRITFTQESHGIESLQIAFLGNFDATESTENLILDALTRGLGHQVTPIQENRADLAQLVRETAINDVFLWVRTPGWLQVPDDDMFRLLESLKARGVPSFSVHLDKFWGIPEREALIGKIPFWKVEHAFTADGSSDHMFADRGVNHHWMQPAMSEIYLHPGRVKEAYRCDVGFVGAKDYHAEYPFRREMVEYLERVYGNRFRHITSVRGHELNDFYASCRVVVGDCIFAGTPQYWSDRAPESCGRGALLLHPHILGLEIPMPQYTPQSLVDLHSEIEYLLRLTSEHRRVIINECVEHVRKHDTWTVRMREILETIHGSGHLASR